MIQLTRPHVNRALRTASPELPSFHVPTTCLRCRHAVFHHDMVEKAPTNAPGDQTKVINASQFKANAYYYWLTPHQQSDTRTRTANHLHQMPRLFVSCAQPVVHPSRSELITRLHCWWTGIRRRPPMHPQTRLSGQIRCLHARPLCETDFTRSSYHHL